MDIKLVDKQIDKLRQTILDELGAEHYNEMVYDITMLKVYLKRIKKDEKD